MTDHEIKTVEAMKTFGGGFVAALAVAFEKADDQNVYRLKKAFPEYWMKYSRIATEADKHVERLDNEDQQEVR